MGLNSSLTCLTRFKPKFACVNVLYTLKIFRSLLYSASKWNAPFMIVLSKFCLMLSFVTDQLNNKNCICILYCLKICFQYLIDLGKYHNCWKMFQNIEYTYWLNNHQIKISFEMHKQVNRFMNINRNKIFEIRF